MVRTFAIVGVMLLALSLPQQAAGMNRKPESSNTKDKSPGSGSQKPGPPSSKASGPPAKTDTKGSGPLPKASGPPTRASGSPPSKASGSPPKASGPPAKASGSPPSKASAPQPKKDTKESGLPAKTSGPPAKPPGPPVKASGSGSQTPGPPPAKVSGPTPAKVSGPPPSKASGPPPKKDTKESGPPVKASGPPPPKASGSGSKKPGPPPAKASGLPPSKTSGPPPQANTKGYGPPVKASGPSPKASGPPAKEPGPPPPKADTKRAGTPPGPPSKSSGPPSKASGQDRKKKDRKQMQRDACWGMYPGDVCDYPEVTHPAGGGFSSRHLLTPAPKVNGRCWKDLGGVNICKPGACAYGDYLCDDPHMQGLRGQHIDWSGVDGGWYCLVMDEDAGLHVNVRLTAPLPEEFPERQLVTGLSLISDGDSLVVEVDDPYTTITAGCAQGDGSVCLANGGLRATVNGKEANHLLVPTRDAPVVDGIDVSSSNLPVECRQFGGDKLWARMYAEMLDGRRQLKSETFEEWILSFDQMAAPEWCAKYIAEHDLSEVQSIHAILKIMTRNVDVRLNAGFGHQTDGELNWDGRVLPELEFWQMDIGLDGLNIDNPNLSGILGETARPVVGEDGHDVMEGDGAFRGSVEDYRVTGALGTDFALLA